MVKPGGTGRPSTDVISARLAPLPPRRSLSSMGGRACVWSKSKTYGIGPPCPGMANRVRAAVCKAMLPDLQPGRNASAYWASRLPFVRIKLFGTRDFAADLALKDLLGPPHEVPHNGELLRFETLGQLPHLLLDRLLRALEPAKRGRGQLHPDATSILGVTAPPHEPALFQPVQEERHGPGRELALLGELTRRHGALAPEQLQPAQVGSAQLELLRHPFVERAGCSEVPHNLRPQLLGQVHPGPLS